MANLVGKRDLCLPLTTLEELLAWQPDPEVKWPTLTVNKKPTTSYKVQGYGNNCHTTQNTFSPLPRIIERTSPKTIVCHDFKGGYLDDKFPEGTSNSNDYTFFHWRGIDTFIYFSHNLVTIPPLAWINAGHRNGVSVLGTIITEHNEGAITLKRMLENDNVRKLLVEQLARLCRHFNFDGYLVNIENDAPPGFGFEIARFLKHLKATLVSVCGNDTQVIWYDAVNYHSGKLQWQNKLSEANKKFFDACDGIYLNYLWKPDELCITAAAAGSRQLDVYVGVDVFGRDCYAGGGFETHKAMEKVRQAGLSVALFAPAWTHEVALNTKIFLWREIFFWHKIWKYLYVHGPASLPFSSSFCVGRGTRKHFQGREVGANPWYNVAEQEPQLCVPFCITEYDCEDLENFSARCVRPFDKEAYRGGNCLMISRPSGLIASQHCFVRLMICEFKCEQPVVVTFSTKPLDSLSSLSLVFLLEDSAGRLKRQILASDIAFKVLAAQSETVPHIRSLFGDPTIQITRVSRLPVVTDNNWVTNEFEFLTDYTIIEIGVLHLGVYAVLLGEISIKASK